MQKGKFVTALYRLLLTLAVGEALLVLVSWLLSAMMVDGVRSLLSSEGVRWFVGDFSELLSTPMLVNLLLIAMSGGCLWRSGLLSRKQSLRDKTARRAVIVFLFVYILVVMMLIALPHAVLLSATGQLWPSPFSRALILIMSLGTLLSAAVYGIMSGRFSSVYALLDSLAFGIAQTAPLLMLYFVATVFYASLRFVCL